MIPAKTTKTIICIGTGGVGKTTLAASMAVGFASEGKKVLVLTIDPSKRLAQTLHIKTDGDLYQVPLPQKTKGALWATVINHQKAFDYFVENALNKSDKSAKLDISHLQNNKLYQQLSGRLSGSQDFTSLVSLYRHVSSGEFDLVILDTPPSQHTWNFLKAPEKISALFSEGIAKWFRDADKKESGVLKKMLNLGTTQVLKILENLTGSEFIKELSLFFKAIQKWQTPLEAYVNNCHKLLTSSQTEFILITSLDPSRLLEAQKLIKEIKTQGYRLTTLIINQIPLWLSTEISTESSRIKNLMAYYKSLENDLQSRLGEFKAQLKVYKCFQFSQNENDVHTLQKNYESLVSEN